MVWNGAKDKIWASMAVAEERPQAPPLVLPLRPLILRMPAPAAGATA